MPLWVSNANKAEFSLQKKNVLHCLQFGSINVSRSLSWGCRYNHPSLPLRWWLKNIEVKKKCSLWEVLCEFSTNATQSVLWSRLPAIALRVSYSSPSFRITLVCNSVHRKGQAFQELPSGEPPDALQLKEHCSSLICLDLAYSIFHDHGTMAVFEEYAWNPSKMRPGFSECGRSFLQHRPQSQCPGSDSWT